MSILPLRTVPLAVLVAVSVAVAAGCAWWLAPPMGTDLSAQIAHAHFFAENGWAAIDFSWYGGTQPHGYSLVAVPMMAFLGVKATGVFAAVLGSGIFAWLLHRHGLPRAIVGGIAGVAGIGGNLVAGRVTFTVGVAFGLAAIAALELRRASVRLPVAGLLVMLAGAASPVAGLFVGVAGAAMILASRRRVDGLVLGIAAMIPMGAMSLVFGDGGWMNFSFRDFLRAFVATLAIVGVAAWARYRVIAVGAGITALGLLAALLTHTPVGSNAVRATLMFALPLTLACVPLPKLSRKSLRAGVLAALTVVLVWWLPPLALSDIKDAGTPATSEAFYAPLLEELQQRSPAGRIEIPATHGYWEAAHVAATVPLARGWLRQLDIALNPLFFTTLPGGEEGTGEPLTPDTYHAWLKDNGVTHVALPKTALSWVGAAEAKLIKKGQPYLVKVWSNPNWTLYEVADSPGLIAAPATLIDSSPAGLTFDAPEPGDYLVRVRPLSWLTITGPGTPTWHAQGDWTLITVTQPGSHTIGS